MEQTVSHIGKLKQIKNASRTDAFLITSPSSVKYFSGYFFYFEYGPSPFHLLPAILMVVPDQDSGLVLADNEMGQASPVDPAIRLIPYESYTFETAPDPVAACIKKLCEFIDRNRLSGARIGIEQATLPFAVVKCLQGLYPSLEWVDVSPEIGQCKLIKDAGEIALLRRASALADTGQQAVLKYARAGMTELELFSLAHRDMEAAAGYRIPLMSDLSSGKGTNSGGGMPTDKIIEAGDLILSDFQPCLQGYWGDSCNTMAVGQATAEQKNTFIRVREALEIGIGAIKPGVKAKTVDRLMRDHIGNYPHHSGHSVGTAYHESPRITPYNNMELMPGMLVALEPAIYKEEYGIRLEHLLLVTAGGCEVLTQFRHRFEQ
ncbi:MAG TPA: Xaa-Pro peptidase family protein [Puia sp.]